MLRVCIAQTMIFGTIGEAIKNLKIMIWAIENLSIPLDRARRVVLGPSIGPLKQIPGRIVDGITRIGC
jgi:hypothetical protein